jgi:hypothetical protein
VYFRVWRRGGGRHRRYLSMSLYLPSFVSGSLYAPALVLTGCMSSTYILYWRFLFYIVLLRTPAVNSLDVILAVYWQRVSIWM